MQFSLSQLTPKHLQCKLQISKPGDALEQEADAAAERVVQGLPVSQNLQATGAGVQRKCAQCEEEERKKMQRKENGTETPQLGASFSQQLSDRAGHGQKLPPGLQQTMSNAFSADFSAVRIHNDSSAAEMNRQANAKAFTYGNDIYFNTGEYNTNSTEGNKLLAHELAHVVQQGYQPGRQISRQLATPSAEFMVNENREGQNDRNMIYFDRGGKDLTQIQKEKIMFFAGPPKPVTGNIELKGFVSEDENSSLAQERIDAVKAEFKSYKGFSGTFTDSPMPNAGAGRNDYRSLRSVEVVEPSKKSTTPNCSLTPPIVTCSSKLETTFQSALISARKKITASTKLLNASPMAAGTELLLDKYFGKGISGEGKKVLPDIISNMDKIRKQIWRIKDVPHHRCANLCDAICDSRAIAYNGDVGKNATYTICPAFTSLDEPNRVRNMIHESAHATDNLTTTGGNISGTDDFAYRHERMLLILDPQKALINSDSYSLLILYLTEDNFKTSTPATDDLSGIPDAGEQQQAFSAIANLEKWMTFAQQESSSLYGVIKESKPPATSWSNTYYEQTMKIWSSEFTNLTAPPALPTDLDQVVMAGIADRLETMRQALKKDLKYFRTDFLGTRWDRISTSRRQSIGKEVFIGKDFFAASGADRSLILLKALLFAYREIPSASESKYEHGIDAIRQRH